MKRTESVVLKFLEYPKYTKSSIQFCTSVSLVSVRGILTRVLYHEKMRIANCNDKLLQKNSLDSFLVIADEIVKKSMGEDNMKPKKKGNSPKTNSQVKRGALNPNKGQNNFDLPIFMCEKITLLENKTILPQIRNYNVHGQLIN